MLVKERNRVSVEGWVRERERERERKCVWVGEFKRMKAMWRLRVYVIYLGKL